MYAISLPSDQGAGAKISAAKEWRAQLALEFEQRGSETVLARRLHHGPLLVQKPLYPEGKEICHSIVLHPPGGIAGGDQLELTVRLHENAHALMTSPGAGKWYRSNGTNARWAQHFVLKKGALLEWLPQETIVFNGALASMESRVELTQGSKFMGWEILCMGRRAAGERFTDGSIGLHTRITLDNKPLWIERGVLKGGSQIMHAASGLKGCSVSGTLVLAGEDIPSTLLADCREVIPKGPGMHWGVTTMPNLFVARCLGNSAEMVRAYFVELWKLLRPATLGREAVFPRIWNT